MLPLPLAGEGWGEGVETPSFFAQRATLTPALSPQGRGRNTGRQRHAVASSMTCSFTVSDSTDSKAVNAPAVEITPQKIRKLTL